MDSKLETLTPEDPSFCITLSSDDEQEEFVTGNVIEVFETEKIQMPGGSRKTSTEEVTSSVNKPFKKRFSGKRSLFRGAQAASSKATSERDGASDLHECPFCDRSYAIKVSLGSHIFRNHRNAAKSRRKKLKSPAPKATRSTSVRRKPIYSLNCSDSNEPPELHPEVDPISVDRSTPVKDASKTGLGTSPARGWGIPERGGERNAETSKTLTSKTTPANPIPIGSFPGTSASSIGMTDVARYNLNPIGNGYGGGTPGPVLFYGYVMPTSNISPLQSYPAIAPSPQMIQYPYPVQQYNNNFLQPSAPPGMIQQYGIPQHTVQQPTGNSYSGGPGNVYSGVAGSVCAGVPGNVYSGVPGSFYSGGLGNVGYSAGIAGGSKPTYSASTQSIPVCSVCSAVFPKDVDLRLHFENVHPEKSWKCPICSVLMLSPEDLNQHFLTRHPNN